MKSINLSVDVGGTYTRLKAEIIENGKIDFSSIEFKQKINFKDELRDFIRYSLSQIDPKMKVTNCVVGFAGAVIDHRKVEITNWKNKPTIILEDLMKWGIPGSNTIMVNDMELAGYGIIDMAEKGELSSKGCETLYKPDIYANNSINNKLIIAPGTGFGTATIIEFITSSGEKINSVLSSEIQHIQIPPFDERHAKIIKIILSKKTNRSFLNYEDFVSGKGLCDTYEAILKLDSVDQEEKEAFEIANLAMNKIDKYAVETLNIFYRCVGRMIQAMALMVQPYGGIYLCGATTIKNVKFIHKSGLVKEFHNCLIRQQLLTQFPVYIVLKPDINISGGLWACRSIL